MNQSPALLLLGGLLAAPALLAQGPTTAPDDLVQGIALQPAVTAAVGEVDLPTPPAAGGQAIAPLATPIHTAADDQGLPYGIWAAGADYKVSFHDGMTFVPYLGRSYPTTQSLHWQTTSAKLGQLELLETSQPMPVASNWRYEYHFGPVTEAYDVRSEGLEQTFVLNARPTTGDLVIRGAITSTLTSAAAHAAHQALTFSDREGRALVEYGQAFAIDANGQKIAITTGFAGGEITLTVPSAWLDRAAMPVVVDPLLTRTSVATWGTATDGQVLSVDVGRDDSATSSNVMVTYTRAASATDADLWIRLCNDDFSNNTIVFSDITTTWDTDQTSCAFVGGTNQWVTAFRRFFATLTPTVSRLRVHEHASGDTTLLTGYTSLPNATNSNEWRCDVGGVETFNTGDNALIVFQREDNAGGNFANDNLSTVYGVLYDTTTASGSFGTAFAIKPSAIHDNERPSVNQVAEGGTSFSWICVYQRFIDSTVDEDWDLNGARIAQNGAIASGAWISDLATVTPSQHQLGAIVEGNNGRYGVVFTTVDVPSFNFKTALISGKQVQFERFDWANGASSPSNDLPPTQLRNSADRRWEAGGVGFDTNDDSHWAVSFRAIAPGVPILYYARLGFRGLATEGPGTTLYNVTGELPTGAACVYDNDNDTFLFAYSVDEGGSLQAVYGHRLTYDTVGSISSYGVPCGFANISWSGSRQIGAEFGQVSISGSPASALHLLILATAGIDVPLLIPGVVFPGCSLYVPLSGPDYLGTFPTAVGSFVSFALPLPENVVSSTLSFQDLYLDTTNLLIYTSARLDVPIVK